MTTQTRVVFATACCVVAASSLAANAAGGTPTRPYSAARTIACLLGNGARVGSGRGIFTYPEMVDAIKWNIGTTNNYIYIAFAADTARGARLQQRFDQFAYAFGATRAEIQRLIVRRANVTYFSMDLYTGLTLARRALITRCLH